MKGKTISESAIFSDVKGSLTSRTIYNSQLPHPTCAICDKRVERMETTEDFTTRQLLVAVYCHGQWDQIRLPAEILCELGKNQILEGFANGIAFNKPLLTEGEK